MSSEALRPRRAAEYLDTTVGTLANWRMKGTGPAYIRQGRYIAYPRRELDQWLADRLVTPGARPPAA